MPAKGEAELQTRSGQDSGGVVELVQERHGVLADVVRRLSRCEKEDAAEARTADARLTQDTPELLDILQF